MGGDEVDDEYARQREILAARREKNIQMYVYSNNLD
jgi:hypothetical protein